MPIVYKYLPAHAVLNVLKTGTLWLARPEVFSDAFELRPHFESIASLQLPVSPDDSPERKAEIARFQEEVNRRVFLPGIKDSLIKGHTRTIVVLSLAENWDSLRLWAHYADAHRGAAIGFDTDTGILEWSQHQRLQRVIYSKARPSKNIWEEVTNDELLFTKSDEWSYENEWRLVDSHYMADDSGVEKTRAGNEYMHYSFRFKPEALKNIIVGCRASKEFLAELEGLGKTQYPDLDIRKAKKHATDYKLELGFTWERV